ncbi:hypothetical protein [Sphingomonas sp.]|uniref:hypothetical protein n=1 Tax=Sphingomonas sp. TaxID=28214 RepID=UPI002DD67BAD|nr:hypothetical protein [Sphingomonas sp.]
MARSASVAPIPGTASPAHLEENIAAAGISLPGDLIDAVDADMPANVLKGSRYAAAAQAQIDTERLPGE